MKVIGSNGSVECRSREHLRQSVPPYGNILRAWQSLAQQTDRRRFLHHAEVGDSRKKSAPPPPSPASMNKQGTIPQMREALVSALYDFAAQLDSWSGVVLREPWGRNTAAGRDVVAQLAALSKEALVDVQQLAAGAGPVELYQAKKVIGWASAASDIAAKCPEGTIRDTIQTIATNLRAAVLSEAPSLADEPATEK
jgi:hypothetical protein